MEALIFVDYILQEERRSKEQEQQSSSESNDSASSGLAEESVEGNNVKNEANASDESSSEVPSHDLDCKQPYTEFICVKSEEITDNLVCEQVLKDKVIPVTIVQAENNFVELGVHQEKEPQLSIDWSSRLSMCTFIKSDKDLMTMCSIESFEVLNKLTEMIDGTRQAKSNTLNSLNTREGIVLVTTKMKFNLPFDALGILFNGIDEDKIATVYSVVLRKLAFVLRSVKKYPNLKDEEVVTRFMNSNCEESADNLSCNIKSENCAKIYKYTKGIPR